MQNKKQLDGEIETVGSLHMLAEVYEEISVMRMQQVRNQVLDTRLFVEHLSGAFRDVKQSYRAQLDRLLGKNKFRMPWTKPKSAEHEILTTLNKNGKSVSILITANAPMYGEIIGETFRLFMEHIKKHDTDVIIIGKIGKWLYEKSGNKKAHDYFEIPDNKAQIVDLKSILTKITAYQRVDVFYGQFDNVIKQRPVASNVNGEQLFEESAPIKSGSEETAGKYSIVFEPTIEGVLQFFEMQVFNALFHQTIREAELARHGSRIKAMEAALDNINLEEQRLSLRRNVLKRLLDNKKRLERLSGISLWG